MNWTEVFQDEADLPQFTARDFGPVEIPSIEEAVKFASSEAESWKWLTAPSKSSLGLSEDRRSILTTPLLQGRDQLNQFLSNGQIEHLKIGIREIDRYLQLGLYTRTARAAFIFSLRSHEQGDVVAAAAAASFLGSDFEGKTPRENRYAVQRGQVAMAMFDNAGASQADASMQHLTREIVAEFSDRIHTLRAEGDAQIASLSTFLAEAKKRNDDANIERDVQINSFLQKLNENGNEAINSIHDTEKTFMERMTLEAPVTYWRKKKEEHKESARNRAIVLIIFGFCGTALLGCLYWGLLQRAEDYAVSKDKASVIIVLTAAAAIATTIVFWVARLLQRLYLSERHMAIDAALRSTLIECYLALMADGKLEKSERAMVLQPVFKSGSDGIVTDDTNIEGLLASVARYLEKK